MTALDMNASIFGRRAALAGAVASTILIGATHAAEIAQPDVSEPAPEGLPKRT